MKPQVSARSDEQFQNVILVDVIAIRLNRIAITQVRPSSESYEISDGAD
jgi:hypothetical protein